MNWFKRKKKVESQSNELIDILVNYIFEAKRLNWDDEEIKQKFREKHHSKDLIDLVFDIYKVKNPNKYKGVKMIKKKKIEPVEEEEEISEEDLEEESEEEPEEETEEVEEKPVKKLVKKVEPVEETPVETKLTNEQISAVLTNHEQRLQATETRQTATESRLFRAGI